MRKQILSLAVALLIGSTVCMAQNRQNGKADREKRMEQIVADLGLNEKQAKDFKAAMEEMRPAKNKSNERPTREEMQKKRQEIDAKINTWREDKFERSVANGTETVFVTLRFCVVRKQLKATLKPNAAGVQLPPHYYRNG